MNFGSLYSRLRLTLTATEKEIKSAYFRLSKIYHPDKTNNCPKASDQFRNITEAYDILRDPKLKAAYDAGFWLIFIYFLVPNLKKKLFSAFQNIFSK